MTRTEKLALLSQVASKLDDEVLDDFIAAAQHAASDTSFYATAPQHVRDSIERGIADADAGRVTPLEDMMTQIGKKLKVSGA